MKITLYFFVTIFLFSCSNNNSSTNAAKKADTLDLMNDRLKKELPQMALEGDQMVRYSIFEYKDTLVDDKKLFKADVELWAHENGKVKTDTLQMFFDKDLRIYRLNQ